MSDDQDRANVTTDACPPASGGSRPGDSWIAVVLPSEIDVANADQVLADLLAAIDCGSLVVVADMSMTAFCDCAGVTALLVAGSRAARAGAELRVVARARPVLRTFGLTGLALDLPVYPSRSAAQDEAGGASSRARLRAAITGLSRRRRTGPAQSGPPPDRKRCP